MTAPGARFSRPAALERLARGRFDVLVVGGGITGAGVALDAAARGLRTALVERGDFASGTSSRSSKLVHGGLRYLQQREYRLVRENLAERQRLLANAPHLVRPLTFVIPLLGQGGVVSGAVARGYAAALWAYDLSGGLHIGSRHRRLSPDEVRASLPTLRDDRVAAGFSYADAWADDARLTLAVVRTAVLDHGAVAVNHAAVAELGKDGTGRVRGAVLEDGTEVRAEVVVNAAGVWADDVAALGDAGRRPLLRPAKGVHLTVPRHRLPCRHAAVLPTGDRRSIFVVPWGEQVYLGTTDTDYEGPRDDPQCSPGDVAYVLDAANEVLSDPLEPADVVGSWAGLRPLLQAGGVARTTDLSRRHRVDAAGGVVTVTGGKLTTYRRMAADTVDHVVRLLGRGVRRSPTRSLALYGAGPSGPSRHGPDGVDPASWAHLVSRFGSEAGAVAALVAADPGLGRPLVTGLPYLRAEAVHAARAEMARTVDDVLSRRTRALVLARDASAAAAADTAVLLAGELGWPPAEAARQAAAYVADVERARRAAGLGAVPTGP